MSFWSNLFSKREYKPRNYNENNIDDNMLSEVDEDNSLTNKYEEYDKYPGRSVTLLNDDPAWNKFAEYKSDNDWELVALFKRSAFEEYVLKEARNKGIINFTSMKEGWQYKLEIGVRNITTTFYKWSNKNEIVVEIYAMLLGGFTRLGRSIVFETSYFIRSPFAGFLYQNPQNKEIDKDGDLLYKIYSSQGTKELWPHYKKWYVNYDNPDELDHIDVQFNRYMYDEDFLKDLPLYSNKEEGCDPCLCYEWEVDNFSNITKGQHVCTIIKFPNRLKRKEYKIYSPASGIIAFGVNGEKTEYYDIEGVMLSELFSVYKNEELLLKYHFYSAEEVNKDNIDGTISLYWTKVAGRTLPPSEENPAGAEYTGFEMTSDAGRNIIVSLRIYKNIPYIVFSVNSKIIQLNNGDYIELMFEDSVGTQTCLKFPITNYYLEERLEDLYDISLFCELSETDIQCMQENICTSWSVRYSKKPLMSFSGLNESLWCPKKYAGKVFKAYANEYMDLIEGLRNEYKIEFSSSRVLKDDTSTDNTCYVYLMCDTANNYYKIGLSNQPEYRERTLQSEKPTIEKICAKAYPNRTIASAIESALHKAYESKRLRGEWFILDPNDVKAIIETLS